MPVTRFVVHATVTRYVTEAAIACPSLAKKAVSPHVIRHYSVFRTITESFSLPAMLSGR